MYIKDNFYKKTRATFKGCKKPKRKPDYVSYDRELDCVSSQYWYTPKGVVRCSDHWSAVHMKESNLIECGKVASCYWVLKATSYTDCGFCSWDKFCPN